MLSTRLLLNLRKASLRATVLVNSSIISNSTASTTSISDVRFGRNSHMRRHTSTTLFSVDDGAWVDGDPTSIGPSVNLYEAQAIELGPVRAERIG